MSREIMQLEDNEFTDDLQALPSLFPVLMYSTVKSFRWRWVDIINNWPLLHRKCLSACVSAKDLKRRALSESTLQINFKDFSTTERARWDQGLRRDNSTLKAISKPLFEGAPHPESQSIPLTTWTWSWRTICLCRFCKTPSKYSLELTMEHFGGSKDKTASVLADDAHCWYIWIDIQSQEPFSQWALFPTVRSTCTWGSLYIITFQNAAKIIDHTSVAKSSTPIRSCALANGGSWGCNEIDEVNTNGNPVDLWIKCVTLWKQ